MGCWGGACQGAGWGGWHLAASFRSHLVAQWPSHDFQPTSNLHTICWLGLTAACLAVQFAFNTLARVSAVSHGVCNVVNRVVVIVASGKLQSCLGLRGIQLQRTQKAASCFPGLLEF